MVGHGGSSAGLYLADPTSPIPSDCAPIVATSTLRVKFVYNFHNMHKSSFHRVYYCIISNTKAWRYFVCLCSRVCILAQFTMFSLWTWVLSQEACIPKTKNMRIFLVCRYFKVYMRAVCTQFCNVHLRYFTYCPHHNAFVVFFGFPITN